MGYDKYSSNWTGVGKTTIVMDVAQKLKARGVRVGGVVSREVRTNNVRIGFEFIDLATIESGGQFMDCCSLFLIVVLALALFIILILAMRLATININVW